jgi:hypothetical protein
MFFKRKYIPKQDLLFFTSATGYYENFVIPYVYLAAVTNEGAQFEFIVDDKESFASKHKASLEWLLMKGIRPCFQDRADLQIIPPWEHSLRFVTTPKTVCDYVYIGDVDISVLENVMDWHRPVFEAGLPYSNVIRPDGKKLTGLHLTRYDAYYPLADLNDLLSQYPVDEELLLEIVKRRGGAYDPALRKAALGARKVADRGNVPDRPVHGIHMSLGRLPFSDHDQRVDWGISFAHAMTCRKLLRSRQFNEFEATLTPGTRAIFANLIFLSEGIGKRGRRYFESIYRP